MARRARVDRLHDLLVPGFVVATEMLEGEGAPVRRVTFANGHVVDEAIVSIDDDAPPPGLDRQAVRASQWRADGRRRHEGGAQVRWTADLLPDALAGQVSPMMAQGLAIMKAHLEGAKA